MSVGLLDFFVLEASDYVDRLGRLVGTAEPQGPDAALLLKLAGGLRGSAAMARLGSFAEATEGVEKAARLLREGRIAWTPALQEAMTAAVADLRALVPMARMWGDGHDERARSAARALARTIDVIDRESAERQGMAAGSLPTPRARTPVPPPPPAPVAAMPPATPTPRPWTDGTTPTYTAVGFPPAEPPAPVRRGPLTPVPTPPVNAAVAAYEAASAPRTPTPVPTTRVATPAPRTPTPIGVEAALPIVPILALAPDDGADAVVVRAPMPPVTAGERFARDVEPLVGSLRARLAPYRSGALHEAPVDLVAAFRPVLASLRDIAAGYGHDDVRDFCEAVAETPAPLPAAAAGALDAALALLAEGESHGTHRAQKLAELRRVVFAATPLATPAAAASPSRPRLTPLSGTAVRRGTPASTRTARPTPTVRRPTPAGRQLSQLLGSSLEGMRELEDAPLDFSSVPDAPAPPPTIGLAPDGEPDIVPIDMLLYRGGRALVRARHLVTQLRATEGPADPAVLEELFDLVELAGAHG